MTRATEIGTPVAVERGGVLRHPHFRKLLLADTISQAGSQVGIVALPLVALLVLDASPFEIGVLSAAQTVGFLLIGLPAGVWVDRMRNRPVMIAGDLVRAVLLSSVPVAWAWGALTMSQLYVIAFAAGIATVLFNVAYQSYLPRILDADRLLAGNAKLATVRAGAEVSGPGLAGWLVHLVTAPLAMAVDAVSFLGSAVILARIRIPEPAPDPATRTGVWAEMREGLGFVIRDPILRALGISAALGNLFGMAFVTLQPIFLLRVVGLDPGWYGTVLAAGAVGGLLGAFLTARLARLFDPVRLARLSAVSDGAAAVLVPLTGPGWRVALFIGGIFFGSFAVSVLSVTSVSLRQRRCPPQLLGRANAVHQFVTWGTMPIGGLLGGAAAGIIGVRETVWVCAAGLVAAALPLLAVPLRSGGATRR